MLYCLIWNKKADKEKIIKIKKTKKRLSKEMEKMANARMRRVGMMRRKKVKMRKTIILVMLIMVL